MIYDLTYINYAVATRATPPKIKASVRKTKSSSDTTITPPLTTAAGTRLFTFTKGKQPATTSKAKSLTALLEVAMTEAQQLKLATKRSLQQTHISQASGSGADKRTGTIPGVLNVPTEKSYEEISWKSNDEGDDGDDDEEGDDSDDVKEGNNDDDDQEEGNDKDDQEERSKEFIHPSLSTHDEEETRDEESFDPILKTPETRMMNGDDNLEMNFGREEGQDEEVEEDELYRDININLGRGVQIVDVHTTQEFKDSHVTLTPINLDGIESIFETTSQMDVQNPISVAPLPMSASTLAPSTIATITTVQQARTPPTTTSSMLLQDLPNFGLLFGFHHQLKTLEANFYEFMQTNQFARAVSSILGIVQRYMDQWMNEAIKVAVQLQSDRLHDEAQAENDEFLKTIDENMHKIIKEQVKEQATKQRNLYKVLVEAYESDKIIIDTYRDTVMLKRRRDDDVDKDEEPFDGSDRGPRDEEKERSQSHESATAEEPMQTTYEMEEPSHIEFETGADDQPMPEPSQHPEWFSKQKKPPTPDQEVYKATTDQLDWVNPEGQQYLHNLLKPLLRIPNSRDRRVTPFDYFINNDLEYLRGGTSSRKYTTSVTKIKAADYGHIKWIEDLVPRTMWIQELVGYDKHALWGISHWGRKRQQFYSFAVNRESACDVYSKRRIIALTKLKIVEWHNYKHLDWITVRRDDDKLYMFKEGNFERLHIQDIEDMLLLLVQGKLTNLTVEERFAFNKKLNLTRSDTYRYDLKRKEAYIAYSNQRGFIYQNKDKQNRLMRIDELHKFSDETLTDVRTPLDDRVKGILDKVSAADYLEEK
nr:hypothetical protein [Tanacetum cinerariifolium]